ncbi:MAG: aminotransferase class V-fold PLP-dependent enzyme [Candidatus Latescibacterota bacterium]|nr:aminotransferase class V-fold PLP-dependent enzyme [Candidatus Latescibacterota bacterium]
MERRAFFKGLLASGVALEAIPRSVSAMGSKGPRPVEEQLGQLATDVSDLAVGDGSLWQRVRREFQMSDNVIHMNNGSIGASPRVVTDGIVEALGLLEADPYHNTWGGLGAQMETVRQKAATFIGADLDEVSLVRNCTEGMNNIATGLDLEPGDEILTTNHEHGGGMACWQYLRQYRGIKVNYLKMPNPVKDSAQVVRLVEQHLTPRTRVCSFMHADTITGLQMPMADIAAVTQPRDILLVCDAAQTPGMLDVDVRRLGVDAMASSSHKWLLAPKGTGILYIRKQAQDRIHPLSLLKGYMAYSGSGGTRDVAGILGHGVAIDFHNALGKARIEARCRALSMRVRGHLRQIPRLRLLTPDQPELSSGMVTFAVDGMTNSEVHKRLWDEHSIAAKVAQGTYVYTEVQSELGESYNCLRFSTHIYNNEKQVDQLAEALTSILA